MEKLSNQERLHPWQGVVFFVVLMALFVTVFGWMQMAWGIPGLMVTELSFLAIAVIYALVRKIPLKEMFPVKVPKVREVIGALLLVVGGALFGYISIFLVGTLFPATLEEMSEMNDMLMGKMSLPVMILVVALTPAVCEEAIHRGAILSHFRGMKKEWVVVLTMALFFGLNHVSFLRFINTAILGGCLTYVLLKSNNFILNMLMHFSVNFVATMISYFSSSESTASVDYANTDLSPALGLFLMIGFLAPVLMVTGAMLVDPKSHRKIRYLFAGILSFVMLVSGFVILIVKAQDMLTVNTTMSYQVTEENSECEIPYTIENAGTHQTQCIITGADDGKYILEIRDSEGNVVDHSEFGGAAYKEYNMPIEYEEGYYTAVIINGEGTEGEQPMIVFQVM